MTDNATERAINFLNENTYTGTYWRRGHFWTEKMVRRIDADAALRMAIRLHTADRNREIGRRVLFLLVFVGWIVVIGLFVHGFSQAMGLS